MSSLFAPKTVCRYMNTKSVKNASFCHAEFHLMLYDQNLSQNKNNIYVLSSSNYALKFFTVTFCIMIAEFFYTIVDAYNI